MEKEIVNLNKYFREICNNYLSIWLNKSSIIFTINVFDFMVLYVCLHRKVITQL